MSYVSCGLRLKCVNLKTFCKYRDGIPFFNEAFCFVLFCFCFLCYRVGGICVYVWKGDFMLLPAAARKESDTRIEAWNDVEKKERFWSSWRLCILYPDAQGVSTYLQAKNSSLRRIFFGIYQWYLFLVVFCWLFVWCTVADSSRQRLTYERCLFSCCLQLVESSNGYFCNNYGWREKRAAEEWKGGGKRGGIKLELMSKQRDKQIQALFVTNNESSIIILKENTKLKCWQTNTKHKQNIDTNKK